MSIEFEKDFPYDLTNDQKLAISQIKTDTTGGYAYDANALLKDNIENFLVKACSVPQATIDTIRDIMLED